MGVLVLLKSLVRNLGENATVRVIMCGLLYRSVIIRHYTVVALMVTDVVVVAVGCSVGVAVGKVVPESVFGVDEVAHIILLVTDHLHYLGLTTIL